MFRSPTRRSSPPAPAGFTLIELLVVISIIALLIGILLPALGAARQTAQSVKCLANQRQFGVGFYGYASDHKDKLPWGFYSIQVPPSSGNFVQSDWMLTISGYFEGSTGTYQDPDDRESPITRCPGSAVDAGTKTYSAHPVLVPNLTPGFEEQRTTDSQRRPTEIMLTADGAQDPNIGPDGFDAVATAYQLLQPTMDLGEYVFRKGDPTNFDPLPIGPNEDTAAAQGHIRYRHGGDNVVNLLYLDGHASGEQLGTLKKAVARLDKFPNMP